jgi:hypothetical protein
MKVMAMLYEERFQEVHRLLKEHGCKPTFSFHKEYESPVILGGAFFYQMEKDSDRIQKEWREVVDARLDVCLLTKKSFSERDKIRFAIEWSQMASLYSMYVSLPTSSRSISLSLDRYKNQEELIAVVENWLVKVGCKRAKKNDIQNPEDKRFEQIALF